MSFGSMFIFSDKEKKHHSSQPIRPCIVRRFKNGTETVIRCH